MEGLGEARERAARLLGSLGEEGEVAAVLGELLLQSDLVAAGAKEAVEILKGGGGRQAAKGDPGLPGGAGRGEGAGEGGVGEEDQCEGGGQEGEEGEGGGGGS